MTRHDVAPPGLDDPPPLPQAEDSERAVLGLILCTRDAGETLRQARALLQSEDFFRPLHRDLFDAMPRALTPAGVDLSLLHLELAKDPERYEGAGGALALTTIQEYGWTSPNLERHAALIRAARRKRDTIALARQMDAASRNGDQFEQAMPQFIGALKELERTHTDALGPRAWSVSTLLDARLQEPRALFPGGLLSTGDSLLLAGDAGLGKSRLMLEQAVALASGTPWLGFDVAAPARVGVVTLELTRFHLQSRL